MVSSKARHANHQIKKFPVLDIQEDGWLQTLSDNGQKERLGRTEIELRFSSFAVRSPNHYTHEAALFVALITTLMKVPCS